MIVATAPIMQYCAEHGEDVLGSEFSANEIRVEIVKSKRINLIFLIMVLYMFCDLAYYDIVLSG